MVKTLILAALAAINSTAAAAQTPSGFEQVSFEFREIPFAATLPAWLHDTVALTFDDGLDVRGPTASILDTLHAEAVRATFFINTETYATDLANNSQAQRLLQRVVEDGHELGNHTVHHYDLSNLSSADRLSEIDRVEWLVRKLTAGRVPYLTLLRAPFGHPFQPQDRREQYGSFWAVGQLVAQRAVHVGWTIDPSDWSGRPGSETLRELLRQIDQEHRRGVVILHATQPETAKMLRTFIHEVRSRGLRFVSCEDYVRAIYGVSSAQLMHRNAAP